MNVYVGVPMKDGEVRGVRTFRNEESAKKAQQEWWIDNELTDEKAREEAAGWGTGFAIWECEVER